MKTFAAAIALALACGAMAEEPSKSEQKPRPALNLRLDDATTSAPRVQFGPPASTQTKEDRERGLPELGGNPNDKYNRMLNSGTNKATSKGVIPSAMDPQINAQ
jgi:hypothetical protein